MRRKRRQKQRKIIILSVVILLFIMCSGYAAFQTNLTITAKGNIKEKEHIIMGGIKVYTTKENDGLYKDITEEERYIYKGANPDNYICLTGGKQCPSDNLYRIISVESDRTIKVIRNQSYTSRMFDPPGKRTTGYCFQATYGCNPWASSSSFPNNIFENGSYSGVVDKDAEINTYLNNDFYGTLSENIRGTTIENGIIENHIWGVGPVTHTETNLAITTTEEKSYQWTGKIVLTSSNDYVKASTNNTCTSVNSYFHSGNSNCYNNSQTHNWLYNLLTSNGSNFGHLITPYDNEQTHIFYVDYRNGGGYLGEGGANSVRGVSPTFYIKKI